MERKRTLYNYLHDALVQQIVIGKIAYGEKLPPLRSLCGIYNVGIRTVRDVINELVREGYVETVERTCIRVVYQANTDTVHQAEAVLARQESVHALIKTLECIMPHIYARAASFCDEKLIQTCRNDIIGLESMDTKNQWRKSRIPLQRITAVYHNDLLQDLCADFDIYSQVVLVPGFENPYREMSEHAEAGLNHLFDKFMSADYEGIHSVIRSMYHTAAESVSVYYEQLQSAYPTRRPEQDVYNWIAEKGRLRVHTQVTRSIIKKIISGIYTDGSYLPSNSELQEEYKISSYTVAKVMESLIHMGLIKKINMRGGYVITCHSVDINGLFINDNASASDALTFLEAIHLLALISKGLAELSFDYLDRESIDAIARIVDDRKKLNLQNGILSAMVRLQPYQPVKNIFSQLEKLVDWGCYFFFAFNETVNFDAIQEKSKLLIQYLYAQDKIKVAETLQDICQCIFENFRNIFLELGITSVKNIKI